MNYIDLHVHTNYSDGTLTPEQVVNLAADCGLSTIAITDHDTVAGIKPAIMQSESLSHTSTPVKVIPGIEISAQYHGKDIHILGLFIDPNCDLLNTSIQKAQSDRESRNQKMVDNLQRDGIDIHLDDLLFSQKDTVITRAHFAKFLVEHHIVKNHAEAFSRYLNPDTKYYVPRSYITPEQAIHIIKEAKGIPVLAHPLLYKYSMEQLDSLIGELKSSGLAGIEVFYSANMKFDEGIVRRFANHYDLLMTGGSDFHGANKPLIQLGTGRGNLKVPESLLEPMYCYLNKEMLVTKT